MGEELEEMAGGRWRCVARRQKQRRKTREICKILQLREDDQEEEIRHKKMKKYKKIDSDSTLKW